MRWVSTVKKPALFLKVGYDRKTGFWPLDWVSTVKIGFLPLTEKRFATPPRQLKSKVHVGDIRRIGHHFQFGNMFWQHY